MTAEPTGLCPEMVEFMPGVSRECELLAGHDGPHAIHMFGRMMTVTGERR